MAYEPTLCPACGEDLEGYSEVTLVDLVNAKNDPEGKARADLILECDWCGARWNAFVALEDFFQNSIAVGA